jgi:Fe-S-cluster containining protein
MKKQDIIKELNKPFQCKKNCGKCCGLVPFTKAEKDALSLELQEKYAWELFGNGFIPLPKDGLSGETILKAIEDFQCVFLTEDKKCSIYDKRPLICKAFGKVKSERLTCPEGCKISNPIKEKDFLKLV